MIIKQCITALFLTVLFLSCGAAQDNTPREDDAGKTPVSSQKAAPEASSSEPRESPKTVVYYFHTSFRCHTCHMIESLAKEAVEKEFADELKSGEMIFKSVNIENEENKHFVKNYKLYTKSIILSLVSGDKEQKWKNLDKIWQLVKKPDKYKDYVIEEINRLRAPAKG
ncbi:MAG: hypothetical protein GF401_17920 [Chitinivibrionales bacterium]|nr:hypothetical protein [Chitinivibrionales bacterium]